MENKAYMYAEKVLTGEITAPSQVRKQCENFIREYDVLQHQDDHDFYWNHDTEQDIIQILQLLNFARGQKAMQSIGENLALWQWFLILNTFCWQHKAFPGKRKITEVIVTVSRKNSKSILACLIHIIAFFWTTQTQRIMWHLILSNKRILFLKSWGKLLHHHQ
ncbi:hypothetical protein AAGG43_22305 [Bacillus paranthracis]